MEYKVGDYWIYEFAKVWKGGVRRRHEEEQEEGGGRKEDGAGKEKEGEGWRRTKGRGFAEARWSEWCTGCQERLGYGCCGQGESIAGEHSACSGAGARTV